MSLNLDARQRAMLQEMGIKIWSPAPQPPTAPTATTPATPIATRAPATATTPATTAPRRSAPTPAAAPPTTAPAAAPSQPPEQWLLGPISALWPASAAATPGGWLVLHEAIAPNTPQAQETAALLERMLRALRLDSSTPVLQAGVWRQAPSQPFTGEAITHHLPTLLAQHRPAMVLLLGHSTARAVLGGSQTLAQLRQRSHHLADGTPAIVSFAPRYLLNAQAHKALAWADLCQALALTQTTAP